LPVVIVEMWEGRTHEQKEALVRAITDAMVEHADARAESLQIVLHEVRRENWASGGVLGSERDDG
jgi:4-oxalocrotonate tautomerase